MGKQKMTLTQRRWLLTIHLLFSAIMLGGAVVFLILSIIAANTSDEGALKACYTSMHVLAKTSIRASTIGTLVTGILLSVLTQWGLFKFYWIIAKEVLTVLSIVLGPIGMYLWTLKAVTLTTEEGLNALQDPAFIVNNDQLWVGIFLQIISLVAMFTISVFKPWGSRKQKKPNLA
ncbi:hypothetical protein [Paenibacillus alginolyticus]|uniref:DUF2269 domain-containing protein n=1 Tax=Paenibacillus alginolyticus TaxID=59839 RepID=A0ABT4GES7_9BACL|nr:hypothetical protein [Paenibacillus alginolyticus]MCY9694691.1 hypothetical protein [Paenibacillus alginolyticus]MEC0148835.1 hypothetical protein [Paenibacillus alginolyticus]